MKDSNPDRRIKKIHFQTGMLKNISDKSSCKTYLFSGDDIPEEAKKIFNKDKIAELTGQWGDPDMCDPVQYHKVIVELTAGNILVYEVFNLAVMMFAFSDEKFKRLFRFIILLETAAENLEPERSGTESKIIKFPKKKDSDINADMLAEYEPGEAWLIFRMDIVVAEKPADVLFLMDIGSRFVFGYDIVMDEASLYSEVEKLMRSAYKAQKFWPGILYCSQNDPAKELFERNAAKKSIKFKTAPVRAFYEITFPVIGSFRSFTETAGSEGAKEKPYEPPDEEELEALTMIPDTYDPCPCASGKKFKFCCKPVYAEIVESMASAQEGRISRALKCLDEAKEKAGETPEILCRYAIVYSFSDKKKSYEYRDRCLALNPNHPRANYILGIDLKGQGKYKEALKAYMRAVENYPSCDRFHLNEVWNNIGSVYYELGEFQNAREAWEKALDYMPSDKLTRENLELLDDTENELAGEDLDLPGDMDAEVAGKSSAFGAEIKEILKGKDFSSIKEMNDYLMDYSMKKNRTPRAELGGLSPVMMAALLYEPVDSPKSPLKFSKKIEEEKLNKSLFFIDAKRILKLFKDLSPVKMTVSKNLNRKFVAEVLKVSEYKKEQETWLYEKKAMNEQDFWWLHIMRIIFDIAGIIRKRKGAFHIAKAGKEYLNRPGIELYTVLFKIFFYKFNMEYAVHFGPEIPEIQQTVNFSLFMARNHCADWTKPEDFSKKVIIDGLRMHERVKWESKFWTLEDAHEGRFIRPMVDFGLFDTRKDDSDPKGPGKYLIKSSSLLRKFIDFRFPEDNNRSGNFDIRFD